MAVMLLFWHRCLEDHTRNRTAGSQKQSHAASHPSATALTFCHHSGGIAPQHYGYFPLLSAFRCEIKTVREWESENLQRRERETEQRTRELTEGVTDALDQKRREHVTGGSQAPHNNTPSLKKAWLPWLLGEVTREEDGSQAYLRKIISRLTQLWLHTQGSTRYLTTEY